MAKDEEKSRPGTIRLFNRGRLGLQSVKDCYSRVCMLWRLNMPS